MNRGFILSPGKIGPGLTSSRGKVRRFPNQFRMILTRKHSSAQAHKLLDKRLRIWDKVITINKRITHANELQRQLRNVTKATQSSGSEAQETARQHQLVSSEAARAGRPDATSHRRRSGRRAGYTKRLARSAKLRHLHAADPVPDGRQASSGGWRNGRYHSDQGTKVHGPQEEVQGSGLINRGLRAPSPHTTNAQALKRQGSSTQAAGAQAPRGSRAQGRRRASHGSQAPGPWIPDKVSGSAARGSQSR